MTTDHTSKLLLALGELPPGHEPKTWYWAARPTAAAIYGVRDVHFLFSKDSLMPILNTTTSAAADLLAILLFREWQQRYDALPPEKKQIVDDCFTILGADLHELAEEIRARA